VVRWIGEEAGGDGKDSWYIPEPDGAHTTSAESVL